MPSVNRVLSGILVVLAYASTAHAQATRTWVSGVGDDVNPCSRTAPCKTFAGAISKTAAGGEIDILDPGGFGAINITKSITIDGIGITGSILASAVTGVIVNGVGIQVNIRNLSINGAGTTLGTTGIRVINGSVVYVENCIVQNFSGVGINFETAGTAFLYVTNTTVQNTLGGGIRALTPAGATAGSVRRATLTNVRMLATGPFGFKVEGGALANSGVGLAAHSLASGSGGAGFLATGTGTQMFLHMSTATANATGVQADAGATITMIDTAAAGNIPNNTGGAGTINKASGTFPP